MTASLSTALSAAVKSDVAQRRFRVLILSTHVVQYGAPMYRLLSRDPRLDVLVAYCSMQGAEPGMDPEFGMEIQWDEPLMEGYSWVHVPNKSVRPGLGRFFGLWNPGLWKVVREGGFDAVVIYTGYMYASFWISVLAAKSKGIPVLISIDTTTLQPRDHKLWKAWIKPFVVRRVLRVPDAIMAASVAAKRLALRLGIPESRLIVIRSGVDKEPWAARAKNSDPAAIRACWGVPAEAPVVLYCAKLQPWKKPLDLLHAFAKANAPGAYLVFAGEGPQRAELEAESASLGISERVRVLGFVNASHLPGYYRASDLFVLPSEYDPCPLVVCEAMFCGLPVILSDAVLGRLEMIHPGESGYIYPSGDVDALAAILNNVLENPALLQKLKAGVRQQMESWTAEEFLDCWVGAVETANRLKKGSNDRGRSC
jgi:glycosyltransferase involved in cell wall biosynthesis